MKKITGWIQIIFCTIFLLIFAIALIVIISGMLDEDYENQMSMMEILTTSFGFVIVIYLLIYGLRNGLKKVKKDKVIEIVRYDKELILNLSGQIEYIDYRNLIFGLTYKKPIYLLLLGVIILFLLAFLVDRENMMNQSDSNYYIFIIIGAFLLSPIFTIIQIKKLYNSNKIFHERLTYRLTNDSINIKGSTLDSTQKWTNFFQIRKTKNFFMFYQGEKVATLLDKKMFSDTELKEFEVFMKSLNVKTV